MSVTRYKESKNTVPIEDQSHQHQSLFSVGHAENGNTCVQVEKRFKTRGCVPFAIAENVAP